MTKLYLVGVTVIVLTLAWTKAQFYAAIDEVQILYDTHQSVINELEQYLNQEVQKLDIMIKFLNIFKRENKKMEKGMEYVKNPINAYTLIKRLTVDLAAIEHYAKLQFAFQRKTGVLFPAKDEVHGAAAGLRRVQKTYALNISKLAAGRLEGVYSHDKKLYTENTSPMTVSDCYQVGLAAFEYRDFQNAVAWMTEALNKYHEKDPNDPYSMNVFDIYNYLREAYYKINELNEKKLSELETYQNYKEEVSSEVYDNIDADQDLHFLSVEQNKMYKYLCRGDIPFPESKRKSLFCYYNTNSDFLRLAPFKVELLHQDPEIYLYHDVISDKDIQNIQKLAQPMLNISTIKYKNKLLLSPFRNSKSAWLADNDSTVVKRLSRRIEDMTGLSTSFAELLQVSHYGIGGQYDPHYDFFTEDTDPNTFKVAGNREASIIFYMSDVEQGGATVFNTLNLTVFPIKNSAITWMNLLPSGMADYRTKHAACPVLRGSKWVSVKWIHESGQEFKRPCNLVFEENKSRYRSEAMSI